MTGVGALIYKDGKKGEIHVRGVLQGSCTDVLNHRSGMAKGEYKKHI
jgi:hypothetical protein